METNKGRQIARKLDFVSACTTNRVGIERDRYRTTPFRQQMSSLYGGAFHFSSWEEIQPNRFASWLQSQKCFSVWIRKCYYRPWDDLKASN